MSTDLPNSELKTDIHEDVESIGEKFNSLLTASSTLGTHFQFTVEKRWDDSKNVTIPSYFVLNLESVAENLSKIPFFERLQIKQPFLENDSSVKTNTISCGSRRTKDSIAKCLENAEVAKDMNALKFDKNDHKNHAALDKNENTNTSGQNEDITCTLNDCIPDTSAVASELQENASLDDWLDSVLDD